ncbi:hypothetical protein ACU8KH_06612 [Lachancea thermotolerans]
MQFSLSVRRKDPAFYIYAPFLRVSNLTSSDFQATKKRTTKHVCVIEIQPKPQYS